MMETVMTLEEVATYLRVSEKTVRDWVSKGELPGGKLGTSWRFRREDIEEWVKIQLAPQRVTQSSRGFTIQALLRREQVFVSDCKTKSDMLNFIIDRASSVKGVKSRAQLSDAVYRREELMSTGIGLSVGVPHVRLPGVKDIHLFIAVNSTPISDYESLDGEPVRIVVFILAGEKQHREHIQVLASVAKVVKSGLIREQLLASSSVDSVCRIFIEAEGDKNA
jgi:PTS system nitrogen regulatory IIA component